MSEIYFLTAAAPRRRLSHSSRFLAALLTASAVLMPAQAEPPPTLVELTALAEERHAAYLARQADFAAEEENENIAWSALLPQVSARFSEEVGESSAPWAFNLSATQVVVDFAARGEWRATEELTEEARANLALARQNLRRDVVVAWLNAQLAADVLALVAARQKTLREQLNRVTLLAQAGRGTQIDVLSARAGLANARSQWEQAKHELADALNTVTRYTGAFAGAARLAPAPDALPPPPALAAWQTRVRQNSLSAAATRRRVKYLERLLSLAKTAVFPRVLLSGGLRARGGFGKVDKRLEASLSQPLFTGGNITAQQRRILALLEAARWRLADVVRREEQEVRRLHGQMLANIARMSALGDSARAAEALLAAIIVGYNSGVRVAEDVIGAEEDLFDARGQLRRESYQYLTNLVTLRALAAAADDAFIAQVEEVFAPADGGEGRTIMSFQLCLESDLEDDIPHECEGPKGEALVVVRHGGAVYAVAGECPHQAAPMADADVADGEITCCLHFWTWTLADGAPLGDAEKPLPIYPVRVENGRVVLISAEG